MKNQKVYHLSDLPMVLVQVRPGLSRTMKIWHRPNLDKNLQWSFASTETRRVVLDRGVDVSEASIRLGQEHTFLEIRLERVEM